MNYKFQLLYILNIFSSIKCIGQGLPCKAGGPACDSGLVCNKFRPEGTGFVCTLACITKTQCERILTTAAKCMLQETDVVTGEKVNMCSVPTGSKWCQSDAECNFDKHNKCSFFNARCYWSVGAEESCSENTDYCKSSAGYGCNPTKVKADGTTFCLKKCSTDNDCRLRSKGTCQTLVERRSLFEYKFCTNIELTNSIAAGTACTITNPYTNMCVKPLVPIKSPCSSSTGQCATDLGCNPYLNNACAQICSADSDCFDSAATYKCQSGTDAVDNWDLMFCKVDKAPECSLNSECVSKGSLFVCNLFTLQCSRPKGPVIGEECKAGGLPCFESVCNSKNTPSVCTASCDVNVNCGSPTNPGTCESTTDITISGPAIKVCKLTSKGPSCDTTASCSDPLVCSLFTFSCEQPPTLSQKCIPSGMSCAAPAVCNSITVTGTNSYCTLPCTVDGNCVKNNFIRKCTAITDKTVNGVATNVCIYDDTTPSCASDSNCLAKEVCNKFTLKCEKLILVNQKCIEGGIPCVKPYACNPLTTTFKCVKQCNSIVDCVDNLKCITTIDPTSIGGKIKVCGVDPDVSQNECSALNPCLYPFSCNNGVCQILPGYGESCSLRFGCKIGYVCNSFSGNTCTLPCVSNDSCGNGRCLTKSSNGISFKACLASGTSCIFGKCSNIYDYCNRFTNTCQERVVCQDKVTNGRNGCKALISYCNKPEFCTFMTQNCKRTCNRCYSSYNCPVFPLQTTTKYTPFHHNIHAVALNHNNIHLSRALTRTSINVILFVSYLTLNYIVVFITYRKYTKFERTYANLITDLTKKLNRDFKKVMLWQNLSPILIIGVPSIIYMLYIMIDASSNKFGSYMMRLLALNPLMNAFLFLFLLGKNRTIFGKRYRALKVYLGLSKHSVVKVTFISTTNMN
uniref:ShKT domain-containing protein n=1 Tax=Rhabditophanes sp. KR3021 TaxID=114890 RepID=A0AC35THN1_9BILA